jgi:tyrosyl-tRNA synthetase
MEENYMNFLEQLRWRGLLHDSTDEKELLELANNSSAYVGLDPTAASLQIGNLIPLIVMIHLAKAGFKPIILFGGATGSIGDPSGRNSERNLMTSEQVALNIEKQKTQVLKIYQRLGFTPTVVNNYEWTKNISAIDFLRDVGKYFTVNYMIAKDVVKARLEGEGISFTEFSYMLLQANDFFELHEKYNCRLQVGGSDQWGNLTAGLDFIRKKTATKVAAFSWPLLTDSQGKKFGKSASGALFWLDPEMTSPFKLHQFWLNQDDLSSIKYLRIFSLEERKIIEEIEEHSKQNPEARISQNFVADNVVKLVHGEESLSSAKNCSKLLFSGDLKKINENELLNIFSDAPSSELTNDQLSESSLAEILFTIKAVTSKSEARRVIQSGGVYLNGEKLARDYSDDSKRLSRDALFERKLVVFRIGKKNNYLVKIKK